MKDIKNAFTDMLSVQTAGIVTGILAFVTLSIVSRVLGPENFGLFSIFKVYASYIFLASASWHKNATVRFGKEEYINTGTIGNIFWTKIIFVVPVFLIISVLIYVFKNDFYSLTGIQVDRIYFVLVLGVNLILSDTLLEGLKVTGKIKFYSIVFVLEQFVFLFLLLYVFLFNKQFYLFKILWFIISAKAAQVIVAVFIIKPKVLFSFKFKDAKMFGRMWKYSWPFIFVAVFGNLGNYFIEPMILKHFTNLEGVGYYKLAEGLANYVNLFVLQPLGIVMFPLIMSLKMDDPEKIKIMVDKIYPQLILLVPIILSLLIPLSYFFIPIIFGADYYQSIKPFIILCLSVFYQVIIYIHSPILASYDKTKHLSAINILGTFYFFALYFVMIPLFGILGMALIWLTWRILAAFCQIYIARKTLGMQQRNKILLLPGFPILNAAVCFLIHNRFIALAATVIMLGLIILIIRNKKFILKEDLWFISQTKIPPVIRKIIIRFYQIFIIEKIDVETMK